MAFQTQCKLFIGIPLNREFSIPSSFRHMHTSLSAVSQNFSLNVSLLRRGENLGGVEKALTRSGCQRVSNSGWVPDRTEFQ